MFNSAEVADLRAMWASALPDTAVILRPPTGTADVAPGGGRYSTGGTAALVYWGTADTCAARWQPNRFRATEAGLADSTWARGPMTVMVPAGTDVQETDVIRKGDGTLWQVRGSSGPRSYEYGIAVDVESLSS